MTQARRPPKPPRMAHRGPGDGRFGWRPAAVTLVLVLIAGIVTVVLDTSASNPAPAGGRPTAAATAARAFLTKYVDSSGRVIRLDQGGDTVSEGQAYAMLIAQSAGDRQEFDRIWSWTRTHLQRPDGLFAWRTNAAGKVLDSTPASDADLLLAWALSRATGPGSAGYHTAARRIAGAILNLETVNVDGGLALAAGPWATSQPASLSPGYWAPVAFTELARATGDRRWSELARSATQYTRSLTRNGALLPPDWARLDGSVARSEPAPDGSTPNVQYGLGAQRLAVWMASSCSPADRKLAARWWKPLSSPSASRALALSPSGKILDGQSNAVPLVASAASALAAGDPAAMHRRLAEAAAVQAKYPTYYGAAWLALGEALLRTGRLGGCAGQSS